MFLTLLILYLLLVLSSLDLYNSIVYDNIKEDKQIIVLITGSSSGIGKSTVLEFSNDIKFKVYATMRDIDKWDIEPKDNIVIMNMDVTNDESVKSVIDYIIEIDNKIDVVINNAGYGLAGCLELVTIDEAKALFDVNVWGVIRVIQYVLPHMRKQKSGYFIQISSTSGIRGIPCLEYYTGSKFALEGITDSMRYSLSAYNISGNILIVYKFIIIIWYVFNIDISINNLNKYIVTNLNAGPVKTNFNERYGHVDKGGKGSRQLLQNDTAGNIIYIIIYIYII